MSRFTFKKSKSNRKFLTWAKWSEGDYLIGKFHGEVADKFGNPSYTVEVFETSLPDLKEGDMFGLNSNGSLNYKMKNEEVTKGDVIRVEYLGKEKINSPGNPFDGKDFHNVELEIAEAGDEEVSSNEDHEEDSKPVESENYGEML